MVSSAGRRGRIDGFQRRQTRPDFVEHIRVAGNADGDLRAAVAQAVLQGIRPEQDRKGQRDCAELVHGNVRDDGFFALRQDDGDAIAAADAKAAQGIGEAVRALLQLTEGHAVRAAISVVEEQRRQVQAVRVLVADVDADVVVLGNAPAEVPAQLLEALVLVFEKAHGRAVISGLAHGLQWYRMHDFGAR